VTPKRLPFVARWVRLYFWALFFALLVGFGVGLWIRHEMARRPEHMGGGAPPLSAVAAPTRAP